MAKLEFRKEELYLLWYLARERQFDNEKYHDVSSTVRDKFGKVSTRDIQQWTGNLQIQGYIENAKELLLNRITKDGFDYYKENLSLFESFGLESAKEDFAGSIEESLESGEAEDSSQKETKELSEFDKLIGTLSDEILLFLLEWKATRDPNLKFWLRSSNRYDRLNQGLWFRGPDYIHIGFSNIGDSNSIQSIGFVIVWNDKSEIETYTEVTFKDESRPEYLSCYKDILIELGSKVVDKNRKYFIDRKVSNWRDTFPYFLEFQRVWIDQVVERHGLTKEFEIPDAKFDSMLSKVLKIRDEKGYPAVPKFQKEPELETDTEILSDNPSKADDLGRRGIMQIIHDKINKLWTKLDRDEPYTILLNGEWGSGKSSMLYYFKEFLTQSNWEVVEYNAWTHQHLENQWWVLVNKVSKQISQSRRTPQIISHRWWSFKLQNQNTLIVFILAGIFLFSAYKSLTVDENKNGIALYASLLGLLGSLWVTFSGMVQNIFKRKVTTSELARNHSSDPFKPIKDRFNEVTKDRKVAIFIDDLDRCEIKPTIKLLEGIQNLFKQTKVLYVIAADGNWISNCFDTEYTQFEKLKKRGNSIGNQFLEKSFQMVVDVPKIDPEQHKELWKKFLGISEEQYKDEEISEEVDQEISNAKTTEDLSKVTKGKTTLDQRVRAARKVEEIIEEKKDHLLSGFIDDIPRNPRQMKRLINLFTVKYQMLIISDTKSKISDDALVRYIIFSAKYPDFDREIKRYGITLEAIKEQHPDVVGLVGEELNTEMIQNYL